MCKQSLCIDGMLNLKITALPLANTFKAEHQTHHALKKSKWVLKSHNINISVWCRCCVSVLFDFHCKKVFYGFDVFII